uniref:DUF3782 domain-containing protein n=1 Tax=Candidatus Kentrum sp. LFY TaxID=2126342 RepID=A0A450WB47_9GAMM|nr:MAG: hypothetical protein BECKLFY1418C_GA0070996_100712 [Candidatus Kentron sp. LFY]
MTDDELKELIASLVIAQKETDRQMKETEQRFRETDQRFKETEHRFKEIEQRFKETDQLFKKTDLRIEKMLKERNQQIKELGQQIGGLGQKFGGFTEGMAFPSMKKLLRERFGMETVVLRAEASRNGDHMEVDVLGYSNGAENQATVVEVKSRLTQEGIDHMERTMARFDKFFPEHADKKRFGIIAAVDVPGEMEVQTRNRGFYLARIRDELFILDSPASFQPRFFGCG